MHEVHHQHRDDPAERGGFLIYPDGDGLATPDGWSEDDLDPWLRDHGGRLAELVGAAIGVPVWRAGTLGERLTSVGQHGRRLQVFAATAALAPTTTRLITEAAHTSNAADRAVMDAAGFGEREAAALLRVYAAIGADRGLLGGPRSNRGHGPLRR